MGVSPIKRKITSFFDLLGYLGNEQTAVIVISAFYLPPKNLRNYPQVISQTFL